MWLGPQQEPGSAAVSLALFANPNFTPFLHPANNTINILTNIDHLNKILEGSSLLIDLDKVLFYTIFNIILYQNSLLHMFSQP